MTAMIYTNDPHGVISSYANESLKLSSSLVNNKTPSIS